jgi:hypothetical protein
MTMRIGLYEARPRSNANDAMIERDRAFVSEVTGVVSAAWARAR